MQVIDLKGETQCHNDQSFFMRIRTSLRKNLEGVHLPMHKHYGAVGVKAGCAIIDS